MSPSRITRRRPSITATPPFLGLVVAARSRGRRPAKPLVVIALAALAWGAGQPFATTARENQAAPFIELNVRESAVLLRAVQVGRSDHPIVEVVDPATDERWTLSAGAATRPDETGWPYRFVTFSPQRYHPLRPGLRVEVFHRGSRLAVVVPDLVATADAATDVITGRAPWPGEVTIDLRQDPLFSLEPIGVAPTVVTTEPDGRFTLDVGGQIDWGPGWWGSATVRHPDGHIFRTVFAAPVVVLQAGGLGSKVRADAGTRVSWSVVAADGSEVRRARWSNVEDNGWQMPSWELDETDPYPNLLAPDRRLRVVLDGRTELRAARSGTTGRYDPEVGTITGSAPPGVVVRTLTDYVGKPGDVSQRVGPDGRFVLPRTPHPFTGPVVVPLLVRTSEAVAEIVSVRAPVERFGLFGNLVRIEDDGSGQGELLFEPAGGGPAVRRRLERRWYEDETRFDLFDGAGQPILVAPGDRLTSVPVGGTTVSFRVPEVSVAAAPAGSAVFGAAPPGAIVTGSWSCEPVDLHDLLGLDDMSRPDILRAGQGTAGADGRYEVRSRWPCPPQIGWVRANVQLTTPATGRRRSRCRSS